VLYLKRGRKSDMNSCRDEAMKVDAPNHSRLRWLDRLAAAGAVAVSIALLLGELGRFNWLFELFSHFLVQFFLALAVTAAYLLLRRRRLWCGAVVLLTLVPAWRLAPYAPLTSDTRAAAADSHRLRVMTINVHASSDHYDLVRAEIERLDPDIVFLPENTNRWAAALAPLRARYPYVVDGQSPSVFSLFLFSRVPLSDVAIVKLPEPGGFPALVARACREGENNDLACVRIIGIHPPPPLSPRIAAERYATLRAVPDLIDKHDAERTVLLGDFNCTPWSPLFRDLLAATGLRDSARGFDLSPTWASRWLPVGLKIDHILVGSAIAVSDHGIGGDVGSDHFPVVADLQY
jgi:endonuclease/exonuclease/phosphatase (EEP) superfamily protein YafD